MHYINQLFTNLLDHRRKLPPNSGGGLMALSLPFPLLPPPPLSTLSLSCLPLSLEVGPLKSS